ncbi:MAG: branched-chain amino acid aminotransferase [Deltaproteobacteria bacterium]
MSYKINKTFITNSRVKNFDFSNIPPFGHAFTDHMFEADFDGEVWKDLVIKPVENLSMHPANLTLHYGQSIFEGMKAFLTGDQKTVLFRPYDHAKRFNRSAVRMSMPEVPEEMFVQAVKELCIIEKNWIPEQSGSALYIRPFMIAYDSVVGVKRSKTYKFIILTSPSGPYYNKPLSLKAELEFVRAIKGGIGEAKTAGNYGASIYPYSLAVEQGYDQLLWLDAYEHKYIQEIGTMNIFFVIDKKIITPALDGGILAGITRDSLLTIFRDNNYIVEERRVSIDELIESYKKGLFTEIFGSGTAAIVAEINKIDIDGFKMDFYPEKFISASFARDYINKIRKCEIPDKFNWIYPID